MTSGGPDRPLILPPRSSDRSSPDYRPTLAEQERLNFKALKSAGFGKVAEPDSAEDVWKQLRGVGLGFLVSIITGVLTLVFLL